MAGGYLTTPLQFIQDTELMVGANHPTLPDTLNRALIAFITQMGGIPGGNPFPGFMGPVINVKTYGAVGNGVADDTIAIQNAILAANNGDLIYFGRGNYKVTQTLQISKKGIRFLGQGFTQCGIQYYGTGPCIQLGTDDGLDWDASNYNGVADSFCYEGMSLDYTGAKTPLLNGLSTGYGSGTYAIRDWRGGSIRLIRAELSHWDYAFWGVQSDINYFQDLILAYCHSGFYFGPRSDQFRGDHIWTFGNDQAWLFQGSNGHLISHWITDGDGSASTNPCKIQNSSHALNARFASTRICEDIIFDKPWLECFDGSSAFDVEAFFEIGVADVTQNGVLIIRDATVAVNLYTTPAVPHTLFMVKADNCTALKIEGVYGVTTVPWNNLRALIKVINVGGATNVPYVFFNDPSVTSARFMESYSVTSVVVHALVDANASYTNNVIGGTGNILMGKLALQRFLGHNNSGLGNVNGDVTFNRSWANNGIPFMWMHDGAIAVPFIRDSVSADVGNNSETVNVGSAHPIRLFNTAISADRSCTLGAAVKNGDKFRVVRTANATGGFNVNVIGATTKALGIGTWCEFTWNGSAWFETAAGSL